MADGLTRQKVKPFQVEMQLWDGRARAPRSPSTRRQAPKPAYPRFGDEAPEGATTPLDYEAFLARQIGGRQ